MSRGVMFGVYLLAVCLQAGAYGLTFMLPRLFAHIGGDEKAVGASLVIATISTLVAVYYAGHLSDWIGRVGTLALACLIIAAALVLYGGASAVGLRTDAASALLGVGWGITYALAPVLLTCLVRSEERVRYFALHSVVLMAGFGLSPVVADAMETAGATLEDAFYLIAAACVLSAVLFLSLIPAVARFTITQSQNTSARLSLRTIAEILRTRAVLPVIMVCLGASVFAGMNNFQTVFADLRGLDYTDFFLVYTVTVVICRIALARFTGGARPYVTIAMLQYVMAASVAVFCVSGGNQTAYILVAVLFGVGYGASYPILAAMAAGDARSDLVSQTLQLFALSYFIGIFGFPLVAGWIIVDLGAGVLLVVLSVVAMVEATMALVRGRRAA